MKISARNQLPGIVKVIERGAVNGSVTLDMGEGLELVANITNDSIDALGLADGLPALALIKASFVLLSPDAQVKISARNRLQGVISEIITGAVNSEVTLKLSGGRFLTAIITKDSVAELGLATGQPCTALIKASHIILAID
ncbi:MAG TPA: TOBE domain-containing protein [Pseudomonas sp.]|jgi:molybdate transport system regulatory protein|uniref:TOBE domain-containing protein n=1 Tax=Pseudomonas sp. TaxID=306 RepID=UPI002ED78B01